MSFEKDHIIMLLSLGNIAFAKAKMGKKSKALQVCFDGILAHKSTYSFSTTHHFQFHLSIFIRKYKRTIEKMSYEISGTE